MMRDSRIKSAVIRAVALGLSMSLVACGPLISFGSDGPAPVRYGLSYGDSGVSRTADGPVVAISSPDMFAHLDDTRITVALPDSEHTTLSGAKWSGHLSDMVQDYVEQVLSATSNSTLIGRASLDVKADCRLGIKVLAMDYKPATSSRNDTVNVSLQLLLVRISDSVLLGQQRFSNEQATGGSGHKSILAAFNVAMRAAATDYSDWFARKSRECILS